MNKVKIKNLFLSLGLMFFAVAPFVHAAIPLKNPIEAGAKTIPEVLCLGVNFLTSVLMPPIAVLFIFWAGFLYMTAAGRPDNIKKAHTTIVTVSIAIVVLLLAPSLVALTVEVAGGSISAASVCSVKSASANITQTIMNIIDWFAWFIAAASVAMGLYSGFLYMTSRGDPEQVKKASKAFVFTIIGVAVTILAFSIISIVEALYK